METQEQTIPQNKSFMNDVSWKAAVLYVVLSMIGGGATGAGVVATKAVSSDNHGLTQDQADVRYLTKDAADRLRAQRDSQFDALDKKMLSREVFEAYHKADSERMDRIEKYLERLSQKP